MKDLPHEMLTKLYNKEARFERASLRLLTCEFPAH